MSVVVGISAHFHDAACCVMVDGTLRAAAQEERFSRVKHDARIPKLAFRYCLEAAGISIDDIDCVAYYEDPYLKAARQLFMVAPVLRAHPEMLARIDPSRPERDIREKLGYQGPIRYVGHHLSHAASAYLFSGFTDAGIFVADAVGEFDTTSYSVGHKNVIRLAESVEFPHSIGLLYSTLTGYLGFEVNEGEYKVMGLAPYGKPTYADRIRRLINDAKNGQVTLNLEYFDFCAPDRMFSDALVDLFGVPPRKSRDPLEPHHRDIAASLQTVLDDLLLGCVMHLRELTDSECLCMAGGVALNCVANRRIAHDGPFRHVFIQPAAGDNGACLGAAAIAAQELDGDGKSPSAMSDVRLGPAYACEDVHALLNGSGIRFVTLDESDLASAVARRLADGAVVGWFQGRMEFGPRALGARSILADPRDVESRARINAVVKRRESFRPFAPAVMLDRCARYFDLDHPSPFMLETCEVRPDAQLPAITHVDGSARVQTVDARTHPRFWKLLAAFESLTGCPVVLNTSFNVKDEPIVCSPLDALICFTRSGMDALAVEDCLIERADIPPGWIRRLSGPLPGAPPGIGHLTYTFL